MKYVEYLEKTGFQRFAETPGNRGAIGLRRIRNGKAEFLLVSLWANADAIARFAGPTADRAVFFPQDDEFLVERELNVDHFDVVYANLARVSPMRRLWRWWLGQWSRSVGPVTDTTWRLAAFR